VLGLLNDLFKNMKLEQPSLKQSLLFALLAGTVLSIFHYNFIGPSQFDTLPTIYRIADPNYLVNDLFTNSAAKYSEDIYFAKFILLLSKLAPIPIAFFILTLLSNMAIAVVTFFTATYLFKGNNWIGVIAIALVLTMDTMKLGYSGLIGLSDFIHSLSSSYLPWWLSIRRGLVNRSDLAFSHLF